MLFQVLAARHGPHHTNTLLKIQLKGSHLNQATTESIFRTHGLNLNQTTKDGLIRDHGVPQGRTKVCVPGGMLKGQRIETSAAPHPSDPAPSPASPHLHWSSSDKDSQHFLPVQGMPFGSQEKYPGMSDWRSAPSVQPGLGVTVWMTPSCPASSLFSLPPSL